MTEFVFQLAVVFVPGLIWSTIVDRLCTTRGTRSDFSTVIRAFGFGVASYFVYFVGYYISFRGWYGVWPSLLDLYQGLVLYDAGRPSDAAFLCARASEIELNAPATT